MERRVQIDIPEDLKIRLQHLAQETGQGVDALVCEAIEARLVLQAQVAANLEGWTPEALRAAIREGLDSGPGRLFDASVVADIKARGRERLAAQQDRTT